MINLNWATSVGLSSFGRFRCQIDNSRWHPKSNIWKICVQTNVNSCQEFFEKLFVGSLKLLTGIFQENFQESFFFFVNSSQCPKKLQVCEQISKKCASITLFIHFSVMLLHFSTFQSTFHFSRFTFWRTQKTRAQWLEAATLCTLNVYFVHFKRVVLTCSSKGGGQLHSCMYSMHTEKITWLIGFSACV